MRCLTYLGNRKTAENSTITKNSSDMESFVVLAYLLRGRSFGRPVVHFPFRLISALPNPDVSRNHADWESPPDLETLPMMSLMTFTISPLFSITSSLL